MKFKALLLVALLATTSATAQERTAGGSLSTEASWTALQNMLNATNGNVSILRADVKP